jgi:AraC family transcriptional activator of tynA and feaB
LILDAARQTNLSQQESEATLDAVISLLRPAISQSEGVDDVHERIFRKTLGYIDEHIRSEDLCPELLAREGGGIDARVVSDVCPQGPGGCALYQKSPP